ncbi:M23 family metallopeptidase [Zymobacter palmae]|uniref:Peptidase M23B n=1 Tax=Zymobacter palmae TaxID=33074 RepID=A0A348HEW7_9GAMM|nr:M23 family metallopeptidase [Zymobacter palmae]BBG30169.1 peptidase M23B [Zymobacter palmae]
MTPPRLNVRPSAKQAPFGASMVMRHPLRGALCAVLFLAGCSTASSLNGGDGGWTTLQPGETLYRLAQRNNRPTACLQRYNPSLRADSLSVGQRILVPNAEECASLTSARMRYRVRRGDTLYSIAHYFDQTPQAMAAANPSLPPNPRLEIGQWVTLSGIQRGAATQSSQATVNRTAAATKTPAARPTPTRVAPAPAPLPNEMTHRPWPMQEPRVIREFGPDDRGRLQPMMLAARTSQTATAVADGSVQFASTMRQLGHVVIVHHARNIQTVYAHCGSLSVKAGQRVKTGTPLCQVAQDDVTASPQLLFDVRQSGRPIDPRRLLK